MALPVTTRPSPSFSIGDVKEDGTTLSISSTTVFPTLFPRTNYALFARVTSVGSDKVLSQPSAGNPLTVNTFPLRLEKDGVYAIRLVGFDREEQPFLGTKPPKTVVYDGANSTLVELVEQGNTRKFIPISLEEVPLNRITTLSPIHYYLQTKPGENSRDERLGKILDYYMEGKKALYKEKIRELDREIRDFDLALRGARNEFKIGRYVEAQRILTLLDKLRSDSCLC